MRLVLILVQETLVSVSSSMERLRSLQMTTVCVFVGLKIYKNRIKGKNREKCKNYVKIGILNSLGNRTTPSYVAFTDYGRLIGDAAKNQVCRNPNNTVFGKALVNSY